MDRTQLFAIVESVSFSDPDYFSWKEEGWYFKRFGWEGKVESPIFEFRRGKKGLELIASYTKWFKHIDWANGYICSSPVPRWSMFENMETLTSPATPRWYSIFFSSYVGFGPASTVYPQNYQEYQAPPKKYLKFLHPPKHIQNMYIYLKKTLKYIEITPKTSPILGWPPKISTKFSYP